MADGQLFKPEKDYTKEVDKQIPEAQELAKVMKGPNVVIAYVIDRGDFRTMSQQPLRSFQLSRSTHGRSDLMPATIACSQLTLPSAQASDLASTSRLLVAIITISKDSGDWSLLNEQILLLSKKHGQLKQATTKMVQVAMSFIEEAPNQDTKLSLIETLRTVTEGKVGGSNAYAYVHC